MVKSYLYLDLYHLYIHSPYTYTPWHSGRVVQWDQDIESGETILAGVQELKNVGPTGTHRKGGEFVFERLSGESTNKLLISKCNLQKVTLSIDFEYHGISWNRWSKCWKLGSPTSATLRRWKSRRRRGMGCNSLYTWWYVMHGCINIICIFIYIYIYIILNITYYI